MAFLGQCAFFGCSRLASVTIPDSVTVIKGNPFIRCSRLTAIVVSPGHPTLYSADGVLFSREDHTLTAYPCGRPAASYDVPEGTWAVGNTAFCGCESLESVTFPNGLTGIGDHSFSDCTSLASVTFPEGVESIGACAFFDCRSLDAVRFPESLRSIGRNAFTGCGSLISAAIPAGVTDIGGDAFSGCDLLVATTPANSYAAAYCETNGIIVYSYSD